MFGVDNRSYLECCSLSFLPLLNMDVSLSLVVTLVETGRDLLLAGGPPSDAAPLPRSIERRLGSRVNHGVVDEAP